MVPIYVIGGVDPKAIERLKGLDQLKNPVTSEFGLYNGKNRKH
jgi:hypothetical protein